MIDITIDNLPKVLEKEVETLFPIPEVQRDYSKILVVDHVPVLGPEDSDKKQKLERILRKDFSAHGNIVDMYIPEVDGSTTGNFFIEYETDDAAELTQKAMDGKKFDRKHTFSVYFYADFDRTKNIPENYEEPQGLIYRPPENLYSWLLEPNGCDQFVIRYDNETEVLWNGKTGSNPITDVKRSQWTKKNYLSWSPLGTYLVLLTESAVELYGGPNWAKIKEFHHESVDDVHFSPDERFLVTFSRTLAEKSDENDPQGIIVWETVTQARRRSFPCLYRTREKVKIPIWPAFHWSHDSTYFSRLHRGYIMIYDSSAMTLVNKKPLQLFGEVTDHQWSPTDPILAAFIPNPKFSKVVLLKFPQYLNTKELLIQRTYKSISNCKLHWQKKGDYFAVKVDRAPKKNVSSNTSFEFFKIREKGIPIESASFDEHIFSFSWEPVGHRFALVHAKEVEDTRPNVSVYSLDQGLKKIVTIEKKQVNITSWSPIGRFLVLLGTKPNYRSVGPIEFYDVQNQTSLTINNHPMYQDIEWDPTGRYVVTYVSRNRDVKLENGYKMWTFYGGELKEERKSVFYQFLWRPRPPSFLPKDKQEWISKKENLKAFRDKYRKEDKEKREAEYRSKATEREEKRKQYIEYMRRRIEENMDIGDFDDDDKFIEVEDEIIEVIETVEEVIQ